MAVLAIPSVVGPAVLPPAVADTITLDPPTETVSSPATAGCQYKTRPAAAQDTSEALTSGQPSPAPLAVPAHPVGGNPLGNCGFSLPLGAPALPSDISAASWLIADLDTSDVLAAKDAHGRFRPASTLKLLTVNVLLRNLRNPNQVVIGTDDDSNQEGSRVGIGAGGKYTVRQLMSYLLLGSGNDVANALARANGGTARTVAQMNARAKALGALDTRAATVSGLDGPGQMTSAYDLALIARSDMSLPPFPVLTATQYAQVPGFGPYKGFSIANENKLLTGYPGALGGKTGFTDDAGNTFVGIAKKNGRRLVVTMLDGSQQPRPQWMQAASLLDWGFALPASSTPVGLLVSSGAQASEVAPTPSIPPATRGSTLTIGAGSSSAALPVAVSPPSAIAAAPVTAPASGGSGVVIWIVVVILVVLAAFAVVLGLGTSGSHRSGRHTRGS
ncbi:MAG: hypothetical protein M3Z00_06655 [Actinomycetota bacterium]|nr:hypothetical protein [Actinomycetota bacterium]